ncbi:MAG: hypothetical protein JJ866_13015 [Roseibium sp.]|uniref:hypothetical protein n=1 Tax=Roseibium sp. TaxID=1936156 RepID=UPI001B04F112|nr:hypothetical protein [Roseibium sp.]MBO6892856.1 hypothetical protein [Roseibium sp.]MBO6927957.1 hypothetical protein [Roseibium sp.]
MENIGQIAEVNDIMNELYRVRASLQPCESGVYLLQENVYDEDREKSSMLIDGIHQAVSDLSLQVGKLVTKLDNPGLKLINEK